MRSDDPGSGSRHGNAAGLPELTGGRSRLDRDTGERACLADGVSQRGIRIVRKEDLAHSAVGKCPAELLDSDDPRCIVEFFEHRFTPPDCSVCMLTQS